ncbi:prepilin peptidase [Amycolatopsis saalfeldensis]|uniref:Type IV leader peptidase family protein n=1 Tax=Amycolatopsis saalfeldensis TaxID=394193 RepID=A0A1H8XV04_9PSEU|nr:A24 family peptidase [Amycolatopsis saalfeldensis]SEP43647.1 Type IV leader peptidase family protein [Amycolatopsis saalfeldensis]
MEWGLFALVVATGALAAMAAGLLVRRAGAPIPLSATAMLAGAGAAVVAWRWQAGAWPGWWLPVAWLVTVLGAPLALADVRHRRLPDVLTLPAYPLLAIALSGGGLETLTAALTGALLFGGAHLLVRHLAPTQLGAGDVKLTGSLGAVLGAVGWPAPAFAAVAASALSATLAAAAHLRTSPRRPQSPATPHPNPGDGPAHRTTDPHSTGCPQSPTCSHLSVCSRSPTCSHLSACSHSPTAAAASAGAVDQPSPVPRPHPHAVDPRPRAADPSQRAGRPRAQRSARVPHGPALLLATWLCAVVAGPGSGVAVS